MRVDRLNVRSLGLPIPKTSDPYSVAALYFNVFATKIRWQRLQIIWIFGRWSLWTSFHPLAGVLLSAITCQHVRWAGAQTIFPHGDYYRIESILNRIYIQFIAIFIQLSKSDMTELSFEWFNNFSPIKFELIWLGNTIWSDLFWFIELLSFITSVSV